MAPAATITSFRAEAMYRMEPPLAGANSIPEADKGKVPLFHVIFVT